MPVKCDPCVSSITRADFWIRQLSVCQGTLRPLYRAEDSTNSDWQAGLVGRRHGLDRFRGIGQQLRRGAIGASNASLFDES
jgi:hypothetical protein